MDDEIVKKAKAGETQALEAIYADTQQMVYFTALGIVKNQEDAQDLVQDTYIKAFQNISRLENENAFNSWLKAIVVNICKNYLKKKKPLLFRDDEEETSIIENTEEISEDFLPQEYLDQAEKRQIIKNIIDGLPDVQRTAVMLYYYDELSLSEVSKVMETTDGTTKSRLNYARKQIKTKVEEQEKKGNKLYASVPMLTTILHLVSNEYRLPTETAKHILVNSLQAANAAAATASSSSASATAQAANQAGASTGTAAKGVFAKIAGATVKTKVIALISAAVVIAGGAGAVGIINQKQAADQAAIVLQQKQKAESEAKAKAAEDAVAKKAKTKKRNLELYKAYYDANFSGKPTAVFFSDLTHDGFDEMVVACTNSNGPTGTLYVEMADGDTVKEIYQHTLDTSMANNGEIYLYTENQKGYLFLPFSSLHNTYNYVLKYDVFSLDSSGKQISFKSGDSETTADDDGSNLRYVGDQGDSKQHMNDVSAAIENYKAKSKLLVSTVDLHNAVLGTGITDPFSSVSNSQSASSATSSEKSGQYAINFLGMTLKQFTDKYGSDYMDYGNQGGGAYIGYEDKRLPYRFGLDGVNLSDTNKIVAVVVPDGLWVDLKLKGGLTLSELKAAAAGSKLDPPSHESEYRSYDYGVDKADYTIIYSWDNKDCTGKSWTEVFSNNK